MTPHAHTQSDFPTQYPSISPSQGSSTGKLYLVIHAQTQLDFTTQYLSVSPSQGPFEIS